MLHPQLDTIRYNCKTTDAGVLFPIAELSVLRQLCLSDSHLL